MKDIHQQLQCVVVQQWSWLNRNWTPVAVYSWGLGYHISEKHEEVGMCNQEQPHMQKIQEVHFVKKCWQGKSYGQWYAQDSIEVDLNTLQRDKNI